ncbi:MAG: hypothetical protein H7096_13455 [Flavobacterium sp.]|nr:hypothetical protein [Pedobacter sp.]
MKYLYLLSFLFNFDVSAQINTGPRLTALGEAGISITDPWSVQLNQAGLAGIKKLTVAIAIQKPFAGYDLSTQSLILIVPIKNNVFGISLQRYGVTSFKEQRVALCYAKNFGDKLYAALDINYHLLKIENYGATQTYSVEAGMIYLLNKNLSFGAHVANPNQNIYNASALATIPFRVQIGASYVFSEKILFCGTLEKYAKYQNDGKLGLEYQIIKVLALRGGISANPFKQYAGFGINFQKLKFDFAASSHPVLGYSPQIALSYEF